jgi:hypothetical protein
LWRHYSNRKVGKGLVTLVDPHLKNLQDEIALAVAGWSTEQLNRHPPGKWCAAEILEHLYLTYTGTSKGFSRILESGRPQGNVPSFKQRAQALVVVGLGYLPSGREAPSMSRPKGIDAEKVVGKSHRKSPRWIASWRVAK